MYEACLSDVIDIREGLKEEKKNNSKVINSKEELITKLSRIITHVPHISHVKNAAEDIKV